MNLAFLHLQVVRSTARNTTTFVAFGVISSSATDDAFSCESQLTMNASLTVLAFANRPSPPPQARPPLFEPTVSNQTKMIAYQPPYLPVPLYILVVVRAPPGLSLAPCPSPHTLIMYEVSCVHTRCRFPGSATHGFGMRTPFCSFDRLDGSFTRRWGEK